MRNDVINLANIYSIVLSVIITNLNEYYPKYVFKCHTICIVVQINLVNKVVIEVKELNTLFKVTYLVFCQREKLRFYPQNKYNSL